MKNLKGCLQVALAALFLSHVNYSYASELQASPLFCDSNLVAYYRLDGNSYDSKNSNNGVNTNIVFSSSSRLFNENAAFNGSSYVNLGNSTSWNFGTNGFTLGAWIKTTSTADQAVLMRQDDLNNDNPMFYMGLSGAGNLYMAVRGTQGMYFDKISTNQNLSDGNWHFIAMISTGSYGTLSGYIDGNLVAQRTIGATTVNFGSANLNLGRYGHAAHGNYTLYFSGLIDDAFIFNRALTATDISRLSSQTQVLEGHELNSSKLICDANLVSYYRLDGNSQDVEGLNDGSDINVSYSSSSGIFNQGMFLQGNGLIDLGNSTSWNFGTNGFSLGAWIKTTSTADQAVFMRQDDQNNFDPMFYLGLSGSGNLYASVRGTEGWYFEAISSNQNIADGNWHLINLVSTGSGGQLLGYLDGNIVASSSLGQTTVNFGSAILNLGRYGHSAHNNYSLYFNGYIDDASIFNRALSSTEINSLRQ